MRRTALAVALPLLICAVACGNGERPGSTPTSNVTADKPSIRLAIVTDLQGQLEPCGCQSRPLGGIDRLASELQRLRSDGVPTLLLTAGDLLFGADASHAHDPAAAQQDLWRAETVVEILNRIGAVAVNPGGSDWQRDRAMVDPLMSKLSARNLAAREAANPTVHLVAGAQPVGLVGVGVDTAIDGSKLNDAVKRLRDQGATFVVALVTADRRTANQVARISGADLVISAGIDTKAVNPPASAGPSHVVSAGRQGEGVLVVDVFRAGAGPFVDASPWSRERNEIALGRSIDELRAKIAAWEAQPQTDAAALKQQKDRLAALEHQRSSGAQASNTGNRFVARWVEIGPEIPRDTAIDALIDAYDRRVNEHNRVALADVQPPPAPPGQPHYVGAAQCQSCHQKAFAWWSGHAHGHAYATLEEANKQFNLSCVGCHVTGYSKPGGSAVVRNAGLTNVGCESCHGPGSAHVEDPDEEPYSVQRVVSESTCVECHNAEHSDKFDYAKYRQQLLVPGHGLPATPAPGAAPAAP